MREGPGRVAKTARIGVLMGGRSAEREVSLKSGKTVCRALVGRGYRAVAIDVDASLPQRLRSRRIEAVYLALHGPGGEDGSIQGLLEMIGMPYTGSGIRASAIAMHKPTAKALLHHHGIPVAPGVVVLARDREKNPRRVLPKGLTWPLVVKPAGQGSTIGVSIVRQSSEWRAALGRALRYDQEALVESYIPGREIAVSVLGAASRPKALPAVEVVAPGGFYDYAAKYQKGRTRYLCPAPLSTQVGQRVRDLAIRAYQIIGCEGVARVDLRVTPRGVPYLLEVNTIPGMTETSLLPLAAARVGIDYGSLTEQILESVRGQRRSDTTQPGRVSWQPTGKGRRSRPLRGVR
ncbi:MAG: D-alanine--D-alanine ligase [Nitrospiraceae bacterium]